MENKTKTTIMGLVKGFRVLVVYGLGFQGSRVVGLKVLGGLGLQGV